MRVTAHLKRPTRKPCGPHVRDKARCSPIWSCSGWGFPCRGRLPVARCALTAPFHPYLSPKAIGGMFSVALSVGSRPPGVTWHLVLWSPDFPLRERSDRPADSGTNDTQCRSVKQHREPISPHQGSGPPKDTGILHAAFSSILIISDWMYPPRR